MYQIFSKKSYRKALKRLTRSTSFDIAPVERVIDALASGQALHEIYRDHSLTGSMNGLRECHVKNDLLLVYQIRKHELVLLLIDLGSHQDVFKD